MYQYIKPAHTGSGDREFQLAFNTQQPQFSSSAYKSDRPSVGLPQSDQAPGTLHVVSRVYALLASLVSISLVVLDTNVGLKVQDLEVLTLIVNCATGKTQLEPTSGL
jgi:hypothetical protein